MEPPTPQCRRQQPPQSPVSTKPFNLGELGLSFLPAPNVLYFITDGQSRAASSGSRGGRACWSAWVHASPAPRPP